LFKALVGRRYSSLLIQYVNSNAKQKMVRIKKNAAKNRPGEAE
jgi:hypothetical protein